jgi:uncharacterized damage-inducible protein DinB
MTTNTRGPARRRKDQPPPSTGPSEKDVLLGFLEYLRTSVAGKVDDAPEPDVRTPAVASGTNLLGLVNHLAHVERAVFLGEHVARWSDTFHAAADRSVAEVVADYRKAVAQANEIIAREPDLAGTAWRPKGRSTSPSLRWALTHMIEETGRHAGHADILRELIDGRTGR